TLIKKASGSSNLTVTLVSALPYCFALATILLVGWSSDRTKERRWHTAICMMVAGAGLFLSVVAQNHVALAVSMFCVAAGGMSGCTEQTRIGRGNYVEIGVRPAILRSGQHSMSLSPFSLVRRAGEEGLRAR